MHIDRLFAVAGSALDAQRQRLNIIAGNLANAESTRAPGGGPFVRRDVIFQPTGPASPFRRVFLQAFGSTTEPQGVKVARVVVDPRPNRHVYNPHHPDADAEGFVQLPNVNVIEEMTNLLAASRAFEANLTVLETGKTLMLRTLEMGR
ncbi:MAG: flagellar basal body rod protein FlgC [Nitrospirae bacterium]|nr:MAG: flagellar basal body rod protein FlgC [Nitrospirota bacterium]